MRARVGNARRLLRSENTSSRSEPTVNNNLSLSVYALEFDVERYQSLVLDLSASEFANIPDLDGHASVAHRWSAPPVEIENPDAESPDFWHMSVSGAAFAVGPSVVERLEPFFSVAGEFLPLAGSGVLGHLAAFNTLTTLSVEKCLDLSRGAAEREELLRIYGSAMSEDDYAALLDGVEDGDPWPVLYPEFVAAELPAAPTFFRVDRLPAEIFLLDQDDAEDTMYRRIVNLRIAGVACRRMWSSEAGGSAINLLG